jgi:CHAT domain-containing protein
VPDEETQELMIEFYQGLLKGRMRVEALREAQLMMKKKNPDPFYWGAFICQGDPGSLSLGLIQHGL